MSPRKKGSAAAPTGVPRSAARHEPLSSTVERLRHALDVVENLARGDGPAAREALRLAVARAAAILLPR